MNVGQQENKEVDTLTSLESGSGRMTQEMVNSLINYEEKMITEDITEISRQEAKNMLEEQLYKYRDALTNNSEELEDEEEFKTLKDHFTETETWLYEEGEIAPEQTYKDVLKSLHDKMQIFQLWREKFMQMRKRKDDQQKIMKQQKINHPQCRQSEQSNTDNHVPRMFRKFPHDCENEISHRRDDINTRIHSLPAHYNQYHSSQNRLPTYRRAVDPFSGFGRSAFFSDPLFGW